MDTIDRSALVLKKKQPFFDWLASIEPDNKAIQEEPDEGDVYLLPDFFDPVEMRKWLAKHYEDIFTHQLDEWYTDETLWPSPRSKKMFDQWFSYTLHPIVLDTQEEMIEKL